MKVIHLLEVLKLITIMLIKQCRVFSFRFRYRCNDFEQVNSGWLILYVFSCKSESFLSERYVLNL